MSTEKYYHTIEEIMEKFEKMPDTLKIKVLYEAIGIMQQYNGRSRTLCIAMAMGYDNFEGCRDTYTLKTQK